jgi:hypothetical protein
MTPQRVVLLILPLSSLGILEIGAAIGGLYLKRKGVFYNPPEVENFDRYLVDRDPLPDRPSQSHLRERHDSSGARPDPNFPPSQEPCVSLYGDSFTWNDRVSDDQAWGASLGLKLSGFFQSTCQHEIQSANFQSIQNDFYLKSTTCLRDALEFID